VQPPQGRRQFLASAFAFLAAPAFAAAPALPLVKAPRLRPRDLVGLVALGGQLEDGHLERAVRNLESLGLRVKLGGNIGLRRGNYAGTPYQQVEDLHAMVRDREVRGIWSARGGSGSSLLLPLLDYRLLRARPKVFVGLSDATALHLAILRHAGLVTFHGPAGISAFSDYSTAHLRAAFMEPRPSYTITASDSNRARETTIVPGVATGRLVGGNLAVLSSLVGTPYAARMQKALVFLEDINEAPYRLNRMLTQLVQSGELTRAAGVMFGGCTRCTAPSDEASLSLEETLRDRLEPLHVPAAMGLSFGHLAENFTIPYGIRARFDASARTIALLETAVL
jgi:muramoyltetrapeptide carboxypeptidase